MRENNSTLNHLTNVAPMPWLRRVRWWAWVAMVLIVITYVWAGIIPLYYLNRAQVPPLERLNTSEGVVLFKHIGGKRGGYQIGLEMPNGYKQMFTCSVGFGTSPGCIFTSKVKEYTGQSGKLWWFGLRDHFDHYRNYVVQVEINGVVVNDYARRKKYFDIYIESANTQFLFMTFVFCFLIYSILFPWNGVKRNG